MQAYKLVAASLLGIGWLVPLFLPPWVSWHHEVPVFAAIFLLGGVSLRQCIQHGALMQAVPAGVALSMFLMLLVVVQTSGGMITFVGDSAILLLYLAFMAVAWSLGFSHEKKAYNTSARALNWPAGLLLSMALISAALGLVQELDVWHEFGWIARMRELRRPGANLGQPNQLGTLLLMGVASLLYLHEKRDLSPWTTALMGAVLALGLAATESRTGLLNFLLLAAWWYIGWRRFGFLISARAWVIAASAFLALFWLWPPLLALLGQEMPGATINTHPSLRLLVWPQLMEAAWQRPWLGWGLRELTRAHNAVVDAYPVSEPYTYAHNIVLDMVLGMGIPLTLLLLIVSGIWVWRRIRAVRDLHTWYCVAVVLPVAGHSMLEFPFAYAYFLAPAMFFLGALDGATGGRTVMRISVRWLVPAWLAFAGLGAWSVVEYLKVEEDFRIVRFESMRLGQTPSDYERPSIVLLTQLGALLEGGRIVPQPGMPAERVELARKVALRFPWPATQNRYALALALNGQIVEAERQLRVMRALHGEKTFSEIKANWQRLAQDRHPQLQAVRWP